MRRRFSAADHLQAFAAQWPNAGRFVSGHYRRSATCSVGMIARGQCFLPGTSKCFLKCLRTDLLQMSTMHELRSMCGMYVPAASVGVSGCLGVMVAP